MFTSTKATPTSAGRALFLLLLLASLIAFRYGWFVRPARGIATGNLENPQTSGEARTGQKSNVLWTDWKSDFARAYKNAKERALARIVRTSPWYAGEYVVYMVDGMDDTHSETILITPGNEYFAEIKSCITSGPTNFGRVRKLGKGRLELCPETGDQPGWDRCSSMNVVRWGQRQYLVGDGTIAGFLDAINDGREPRADGVGDYFMRKGDWEKPVEGKPLIPKPD